MVEALGCHQNPQLHAPIARDYISFNNQPSFDDVN